MTGTRATTLVHDGPHIQALVREGSSPYILVTFNGRGFRADGKRIWAEPVVEKLDLNAVGFVTKKPNWFPAEDLAAAVAAAQPFLTRFDERIGYGYSQGAYAAIKASHPLGLTRTVAVSPQYSIDPDDVVDERFNRFYESQINRGMAIVERDVTSPLLILYDAKRALDERHVQLIPPVAPDANVIHVPFTSHDTIDAIKGSEAFRALIASLYDGSTAATVSRLRRASDVRAETMIYRALKKDQFSRASAILNAADFSNAGRTAALMRFAQGGGSNTVVRESVKHAAENPKDAMAQAVSALILFRSGKKGRARAAATRASDLANSTKIKKLATRVLSMCDRAAAGQGRRARRHS